MTMQTKRRYVEQVPQPEQLDETTVLGEVVRRDTEVSLRSAPGRPQGHYIVVAIERSVAGRIVLSVTKDRNRSPRLVSPDAISAVHTRRNGRSKR
jgi:hypothetical protein